MRFKKTGIKVHLLIRASTHGNWLKSNYDGSELCIHESYKTIGQWHRGRAAAWSARIFRDLR